MTRVWFIIVQRTSQGYHVRHRLHPTVSWVEAAAGSRPPFHFHSIWQQPAGNSALHSDCQSSAPYPISHEAAMPFSGYHFPLGTSAFQCSKWNDNSANLPGSPVVLADKWISVWKRACQARVDITLPPAGHPKARTIAFPSKVTAPCSGRRYQMQGF